MTVKNHYAEDSLMKHDEDMQNGIMGRLKMNVNMKRLRMYISEYSQ